MSRVGHWRYEISQDVIAKTFFLKGIIHSEPVFSVFCRLMNNYIKTPWSRSHVLMKCPNHIFIKRMTFRNPIASSREKFRTPNLTAELQELWDCFPATVSFLELQTNYFQVAFFGQGWIT